jgi:hypothetical protein
MSAVYDSRSNEFILFGGIGNGSILFNDVWVLSNANGSGGTPTWTQLSPMGTPPPVRYIHTATYDPTTNRMTIFGGGGSSGLLGDTWVLTDANGVGGNPAWMQIAESSVDFPEARGGHTAVYEPTSNTMIVFGGGIAPTLTTNDVFILSNANGQ